MAACVTCWVPKCRGIRGVSFGPSRRVSTVAPRRAVVPSPAAPRGRLLAAPLCAAGSRDPRTDPRRGLSPAQKFENAIQDLKERPDRLVVVTAAALGASLLVGPVIGSLGLAAAGVSMALFSGLAFGGVMLAMGLAFGGIMLSVFGTIFGAFVLPALIPLAFAGLGLWFWNASSKDASRRGDSSRSEYGGSLRSSSGGRGRVMEVEPERPSGRSAEEEAAARELKEELDAFDVLLKNKAEDSFRKY